MKKIFITAMVITVVFTTYLFAATEQGGGPPPSGAGGAPDSTSIARNGSRAPTADIPWGSFKITSLADPMGAQDAATKNYVDTTFLTAEVDPFSLHLNGDNEMAASIIPDTDVSYDLGSSTKRWVNGYIDNLQFIEASGENIKVFHGGPNEGIMTVAQKTGVPIYSGQETFDKDRTDDNSYFYYGWRSGASVEALELGFESSTDEYFISTASFGLGSTRKPLNIGWGHNDNAIRIANATNVEINRVLSANENIVVANTKEIHFTDSSAGLTKITNFFDGFGLGIQTPADQYTIIRSGADDDSQDSQFGFAGTGSGGGQKIMWVGFDAYAATSPRFAFFNNSGNTIPKSFEFQYEDNNMVIEDALSVEFQSIIRGNDVTSGNGGVLRLRGGDTTDGGGTDGEIWFLNPTGGSPMVKFSGSDNVLVMDSEQISLGAAGGAAASDRIIVNKLLVKDFNGPTVVSSDNQAISVTKSLVILDPNSAVATDRTIVLGTCLVGGTRVTIQIDGGSSGALELADAAQVVLAGTWTGDAGDTIDLICGRAGAGLGWYETSRSAN